MFTYPVYKAIKLRLNTIAPAYYYLSQYTPSKDNTSYIVPAVYIEMPRSTQLHFYGRKLLTAKNAEIKLHYISHAPFKNHENTVQDTAIQAHETKVAAMDKLMTGWCARLAPQPDEVEGLLLTQQFIPVLANMNTFIGSHLVSVITYRTEIYARHLQV